MDEWIDIVDSRSSNYDFRDATPPPPDLVSVFFDTKGSNGRNKNDRGEKTNKQHFISKKGRSEFKTDRTFYNFPFFVFYT